MRRCAGRLPSAGRSLHPRRLPRTRRHDRHGPDDGLARRSAHQPLHLPAGRRASRCEHGQDRLLDLEIRVALGRRLRHRHHRRHERGRAGRQPAVPARVGLRTSRRHAPRHGVERLDAVCARQFRHRGRGRGRTFEGEVPHRRSRPAQRRAVAAPPGDFRSFGRQRDLRVSRRQTGNPPRTAVSGDDQFALTTTSWRFSATGGRSAA